MKKIRTRNTLVAILLLSALLLASCGTAAPTASSSPAASESAATESAAASTEPAASESTAPEAMEEMEISISVWDVQNSFPEGDMDEIAKMVADKFKVKLTPVNVGWGDADEKYNTWAASDQLPDVIGAIAHVGQARYFQWIEDGVVRALPADVSKYPEAAKLLQLPEVTAYQVEGKNWFLPRATYGDPAWWAMDRGLIVRKDWMEKLGIAEPVTEEDWISMTTAFAKKDPDGNGKDDTAGFTPQAAWILTSQGWPGFGYTDTRWMKGEDGNYIQPISGEKTFTMMKFFRKMYQAGGLDPDFATLENNQALEKFAAGKTGVLGRQTSPKHLKAVMDAWVKVQPDKDFADSVMLMSGPKVEDNYTRFSEMSYWSESYFNVKVDDAKMDRILQLYDWLYSKEGMYAMMYGIEGKDWKMENNAITLLTPVDEKTGLHTATSVLYPFTSAMGYLAAWTGDLVQYEDPSIPDTIRNMAVKERDMRVSTWKDPQINWSVQAINVPEKQEMAAVKFGDDWVKFIMESKDKNEDELYKAMKASWDANGYAAAVEAVTREAVAKGY